MSSNEPDPRIYRSTRWPRRGVISLGAGFLVMFLTVNAAFLAPVALAAKKAKPNKTKIVSSGPVTIRMDVDVKVVYADEPTSSQVDTFKLAGEYRVASFPQALSRAVPWTNVSAVATATHTTDDKCGRTESSGTGPAVLGPNDGVQFFRQNTTGKKHMFVWLGSIKGAYTVSTTTKDCVQRINVGDPTSFVLPLDDNSFAYCPIQGKKDDSGGALRLYQSANNSNVYSLECTGTVVADGTNRPSQATIKIVATLVGTPKFHSAGTGG